jgi:hypothetical protein
MALDNVKFYVKELASYAETQPHMGAFLAAFMEHISSRVLLKAPCTQTTSMGEKPWRPKLKEVPDY